MSVCISRRVSVISKGHVIGDPSPNPTCVSFHANTLGKRNEPICSPLSYG